MSDENSGVSQDNQAEMAEKLAAAGKAAERVVTARRERDVKGSHLLEPMLSRASGSGLTVVEKTGFHMVTGAAGKSRRVYIAKKGGRVDLSGFTVEHQAVAQLSAEDAKVKHLGKVRGQLDFDKDDAFVMEAFEAALTALAEAPTTGAPAPQA